MSDIAEETWHRLALLTDPATEREEGIAIIRDAIDEAVLDYDRKISEQIITMIRREDERHRA